jgi:flagellar hook-basal body complex protein FliE
MNISFSGAAGAYANAAKALGGSATSQPKGLQAGTGSGGAFTQALENVGQDAIDSLKAGDKATLEAVTGKAQLSDVVTAVTNAEVTLQTVVAVRDKVIQAYQEILRMPI